MRLNLLKPNTADWVEKKQNQQKEQSKVTRVFTFGQDVSVKNHSVGRQWLPGTVIQVTGLVSYQVKLHDGQIRRCYQCGVVTTPPTLLTTPLQTLVTFPFTVHLTLLLLLFHALFSLFYFWFHHMITRTCLAGSLYNNWLSIPQCQS